MLEAITQGRGLRMRPEITSILILAACRKRLLLHGSVSHPCMVNCTHFRTIIDVLNLDHL